MINKHVLYERPQVIGRISTKGSAARARKESEEINVWLQGRLERCKTHMTILLTKDAGNFPAGLVLELAPEVGRVLIHRRHAILERDVNIDAEIDGEFEDVLEAMNLGPINATTLNTKEELK